MTNRNPETAVLISAEKLAAMADAITKSVVVFREAADVAKANKGLATFSVKSGEQAVVRAQAFANALEKAIYAAKSNQPFTPGELKPRSTAKKTMDIETASKAVEIVSRKKKKP